MALKPAGIFGPATTPHFRIAGMGCLNWLYSNPECKSWIANKVSRFAFGLLRKSFDSFSVQIETPLMFGVCALYREIGRAVLTLPFAVELPELKAQQCRVTSTINTFRYGREWRGRRDLAVLQPLFFPSVGVSLCCASICPISLVVSS